MGYCSAPIDPQGEKRRQWPMKFSISISRDEEGVFVAECPAIPGCISQGATEAEAEDNIQDAIRECLEVRASEGMPLTVTTREVEVSL